jgi:two-component system, OmpR family, catabolic regulation response regulator CreB
VEAPRILLIEDEPGIADAILYALTRDGFVVEWKSTLREGLAAFDASVDLVLMDVGLPDGSGFDGCREILRRRDVPVVFLTARAEEIDRIVGLEIGADDYVVKPFSPRELVARLRARLRARGARSMAPAPNLGDPTVVTDSVTQGAVSAPFPMHDVCGFCCDAERARITYRAHELDLTRTEYGILLALLAKPGRVLSRARLMELAWDEGSPSLERTVDAHVKSLRAKLKGVDPQSDPIETRRGLGYCLKEST